MTIPEIQTELASAKWVQITAANNKLLITFQPADGGNIKTLTINGASAADCTVTNGTNA